MSKLFLVYGTENAGEDMRLRAETENEKLKQAAQTQDVVSTQAMSVL